MPDKKSEEKRAFSAQLAMKIKVPVPFVYIEFLERIQELEGREAVAAPPLGIFYLSFIKECNYCLLTVANASGSNTKFFFYTENCRQLKKAYKLVREYCLFGYFLLYHHFFLPE